MLVRPQACTELKYSLIVNIPPACLTFDRCELAPFASAATTILTVLCENEFCTGACMYPHKEAAENLLMF